MLSWFGEKFMQANPDKETNYFNNHDTPGRITLNNTILNSDPVVSFWELLIPGLCFIKHKDV